MLTSVDVKFIFDSARLGLFSAANIFQIVDVALRVVFLLFLPCFQLLFRLVRTLETSEMSAAQMRSLTLAGSPELLIKSLQVRL